MYDYMINKFIVFVFPLSWMAHKMENVNVRTKEKKRKRLVLCIMQMFNICSTWKIGS